MGTLFERTRTDPSGDQFSPDRSDGAVAVVDSGDFPDEDGIGGSEAGEIVTDKDIAAALEAVARDGTPGDEEVVADGEGVGDVGDEEATDEEIAAKLLEELCGTDVKFPLRRARLVRRLHNTYGWSFDRITRGMGFNRSNPISNQLMALLRLPEEARCFFEDDIPEEHRLSFYFGCRLLREAKDDPVKQGVVAKIASEQGVPFGEALKLAGYAPAPPTRKLRRDKTGFSGSVPDASALPCGIAPTEVSGGEILQVLEDCTDRLRRITEASLHTMENVFSSDEEATIAAALDRFQGVTDEVFDFVAVARKHSAHLKETPSV